MIPADTPASRFATRLAFLVAGFGMACWAPMVPFAKERLSIDEGALGLLLLCLGCGSVLAMLATGMLCSRFGCRPVILSGAIGLAALLPVLAIASTTLTLGAALLVFGGALGALDVAMNIHAVDVERDAGRPLMSGFHGLYSIGGFADAAAMTALLSAGAGIVQGAVIGSALMAAATAAAWPRLLRHKGADDEPHFAFPRGIVILLAGLAAITFLAEGAVLDWSALLITEAGFVNVEQGGIGYMLFAVAMTAGRLSGDALTARIGDRAAVTWGGAAAIAGFVVLLAAPLAGLAMAGFVLIGLGAANIVPVLVRQAGIQTVMPANLAIAALTMVGYAGILAGPAAIGFIARLVGLPGAFWMLAGLLCLVPLSGPLIGRRRT